MPCCAGRHPPVAVDITKDSVQDAVFDLTHGQGAHVGFDAAGKPDSINNTLQSLRFGGRLVIIGIPSQVPLGIDLWRAMKREIAIQEISLEESQVSQDLEHTVPFQIEDE